MAQIFDKTSLHNVTYSPILPYSDNTTIRNASNEERNPFDSSSTTQDTIMDDGQFKPAALVRCPIQVVHPSDGMFVLNKPTCTIGRSTDCDITFRQSFNTGISRFHAQIYFRFNKWWIFDSNSTNGISLDGKLIKREKPHPLFHGSKIAFSLSMQYIFTESIPRAQVEDVNDDVFASIENPLTLNLMGEIYILKQQNESLKSLNETFKKEKNEAVAQLKDQKDFFRNMNKSMKMSRLQLNDMEAKLNTKKKNLHTLIDKYQALLEELQSSSPAKALREKKLTNRKIFTDILREMTCSICTDYIVTPIALNCSHVFCLYCITNWKRHSEHQQNEEICPVCRTDIETETHVLPLANIINLVLDIILDGTEKEERAHFVEERRLLQEAEAEEIYNTETELSWVDDSEMSSDTESGGNEETEENEENEESDDEEGNEDFIEVE